MLVDKEDLAVGVQVAEDLAGVVADDTIEHGAGG